MHARPPQQLDVPARPRFHWTVLVGGAVSLAVTAPILGEVYASLGEAAAASAWWVLVAVGCVAMGFASSWTLQKATLRAERWGDVVAPHLAGNAASNLLPFGSALGSVVQLRMLRRNGLDLTRSVTALSISGMLSTAAGLLIFPLLMVLPLGDTPGLDTESVARVGVVVLLVSLAACVVTLRSDRPMRAVARGVYRSLCRVPRCHPPADLELRIMRERDGIRDVLRRRKAMTITTSIGRVLGDYFALYAALLAVGLRPSPIVVLAAFVAANAAGMVPLTPGGLGFVEAGLAGAIVLAGAAEEQALAAVAIYRLASCWLPVAAGAVAYVWSRRQPAAVAEPAPPVAAPAAALSVV